MKVVLDAAVAIAYLDDTDAHHEAALTLLLAHAGAELTMSVLNHGEALVGPERLGRLSAAAEILARIGVTTVALPADAGPRLAELRATTGSKMPDCCVLLTARALGARVATFDDRLRASARQLGLDLA